MSTPWYDLYSSDLQALWALLVVPFAFLVYRGVRGRPSRFDTPTSRFVWVYGWVWTIQTMLDPLCTGALSRALGISDGFAGTVLMFTFVLLGDLRVFALVFGVAGGGSSGWRWRACLYTLAVPLFAGVVYGGLGMIVEDLHGQVLWLTYEAGFIAMAVYLARFWIPANVAPESATDGVPTREFLRSCAGYAGAYYALWAAADVMVLCGLDEGWGVRVVPNQLYYAWWVPFVHFRYFGMARRAS